MTWRTLALLAVLLPANAASPQDTKSFSDRDDLARDSLQSGSQFLTPETRATQSDDFANPGYLWVDRGETLFREGGETSCAACHAAESDHPMKGVATRYPKFDARADTLLDLSGRINLCRATFQAKPALAHESEDLLSLSAYVASRSRGMPMAVEVTAESQPWFDAGRDYFFRRRGQLNLACNQCHDDNWGRQLRGDTISQGHPNAWPGYRLEWQTLGSLHRRLQDCDAGVRAAPHEAGSDEYLGLELYLGWRARGLLMETPGIRR